MFFPFFEQSCWAIIFFLEGGGGGGGGRDRQWPFCAIIESDIANWKEMAAAKNFIN